MDKLLEIKDARSVAITANGSASLTNVQKGLANLILNVTESHADTTTVFTLQESADGSIWTDIKGVSLSVGVSDAGQYEIPFVVSKSQVRLSYAPAGTTKSVKFHAYLEPVFK